MFDHAAGVAGRELERRGEREMGKAVEVWLEEERVVMGGGGGGGGDLD